LGTRNAVVNGIPLFTCQSRELNSLAREMEQKSLVIRQHAIHDYGTELCRCTKVRGVELEIEKYATLDALSKESSILVEIPAQPATNKRLIQFIHMCRLSLKLTRFLFSSENEISRTCIDLLSCLSQAT
jgi:hypothetical protein